ncbi:hypothetical protein RND81_03G093700 [Saponaria officinalis]|uniref:Uncharacterized protein n=1 Tax=Saponaria officinalis TaxID=3572 RepID=A0AAW1M532_SAPOF
MDSHGCHYSSSCLRCTVNHFNLASYCCDYCGLNDESSLESILLDTGASAVGIDRSGEENTRSGMNTPKRQKIDLFMDESQSSKKFRAYCMRFLERSEEKKTKENVEDACRAEEMKEKEDKKEEQQEVISLFSF